MNIEFEVKDILRSGLKPIHKVFQIKKITNFSRKSILTAIYCGETDVSKIYEIIINSNNNKNEK